MSFFGLGIGLGWKKKEEMEKSFLASLVILLFFITSKVLE
jgi:hypothetical protein